MKETVKKLLCNKDRTIPVLSYPIAKPMNGTVFDFVTSATVQANAMQYLANRYPVGAVFNMMDLSVEAEAFGANVHFDADKIPEVKGTVLHDTTEIALLRMPSVRDGRCPVFIEGMKRAKERITDVPVFCGVIGPYSLACRLMGMTELMMACFDCSESVCVLLDMCSTFLISYVSALKEAGADGVLLCEPVAGLLSPDMADAFSFPFVSRIFKAVSDDSFVAGYHNCGAAVSDMTESLCGIKADIYHFGNGTDMKKIIPLLPKDSMIAGNIDPLLFKTGNHNEIISAIRKVYDNCGCFENFLLSTGCDVPPDIDLRNLDTYFSEAEKLFGSGY